MSVFNVISLFGGLALFLYGMRLMGDGLKQGSSSTFKKAMEKVTNNPFVGFLLGLFVTAIIQSSTATIVITSGLVGAGIISLHQSLGIILGANVGTTMTGQIIRLLDINADASSWLNVFKPSTLAPIAAVIGILLIMAFKFHNSDTFGHIAMGFGILFTGLLNMTAAVAPLSDSPAFAQIFISFSNNPVLGFLAGAGVAFAIQSSSATIGILQALSVTGMLSFSSIYSIIIGIYLGDCVTTAIVCSIGAKPDAKRTGMVHILFNLSEAVLVLGFVTIAHAVGLLDSIWNVPITSGGIANTHTIFNLVCALLLLPVCGLFEKLSYKIVKGDQKASASSRIELEALDEKFFSSPALALSSAHKTISAMAQVASVNTRKAMALLTEYDASEAELITEDENYIDTLADSVSNYLIRLSPHLETENDNALLNYYLQSFTEFERIGDLAVNLMESAQQLKENQRTFSDTAKKELAILGDAMNDIITYAGDAFESRNSNTAYRIEPLEEVVDDLVEHLRGAHTRRLRRGECSVYAGLTFLDVLTNVERIADQCSNIGIYTISLSDAQIMKTHHDYQQQLHQGNDPFFNSEYQVNHDHFFGLMETIQEEN